MGILAIKGGEPIRKKPFPFYRTVGKEEKEAVARVIDSGVLSGFLGSRHEKFFGGPEVRALEKEWAEYFGIKYAISVNSATSGLYAAVGASSIGPGDEVIVSPYTMSASATAPLIWGGVPVFADIEKQYFCLDPASVEKRITEHTRAIIVVDIFGQPYDVEKMNALAKQHNLTVIEDAAQAIGATYNGKFTGTLGDIGVYSLNCHKHIQCGEGGVVVTNNDELANRVRLIRNHAEAVVEEKDETNLINMIGYNLRMTEIEAAIASCQLKKLAQLLRKRQENCAYLKVGLEKIPVLSVPEPRPRTTHAYYVQPIIFDEKRAGLSRDVYLDAVKKELMYTEGNETLGVQIGGGYCKPLYFQPMYQMQIAHGPSGYPFHGSHYKGTANYNKGICPFAEYMHEHDLILSELIHPLLTKSDMDDIIRAFEKVWEHRGELS